MFKISQADPSDIPAIIAIAKQTWWRAYEPILSAEQIHYMLRVFYSPEVLGMEMSLQTFLVLRNDGVPYGFASYGPRPEAPSVYKLHKLYVLPQNQSSGYGKALIAEIKKRMLTDGVHTLDLNVNRYNPARHFYEKIGFTVLREEDIPIGPYWMNDYVMRLAF